MQVAPEQTARGRERGQQTVCSAYDGVPAKEKSKRTAPWDAVDDVRCGFPHIHIWPARGRYGGQTRDGPDAGVDVADLETQGFPHHMENSLHDMYFTVRQLRRKT